MINLDISGKKVVPYTLIYLKSEGRVLLLKRAISKGMVPAGSWLGFGGRMEAGEDLMDCAKREFMEETGLRLLDPHLRGHLTLIHEKSQIDSIFIFVASKYDGVILGNTVEGQIQWHDQRDIENLAELAPHQKSFLGKLLTDDKFFYSGVAVYRGVERLDYADGGI